MNVSQLKDQISAMYCCVNGPPMAYFELPTSNDLGAPVLRIQYVTVRVAVIGEQDVAEPLLTQWVYAKLSERVTKDERADRTRVLFWRIAPSIGEFIDEKGRTCTVLRMRLAIPGVDLSEIVVAESQPARWL